MPVIDLMKKRCSVRKFQDRPVERDLLMLVLEAGRVAPSACNYQPWHFVVLTEPALIAKIGQGWVTDAPALIVVCGDHRKSWRRNDGKDHCDLDIAITVDHMTLAAAELGLGTCWVCWFDAFACAMALQLPPHIEPVVLLPIGYPAEGADADPDRHDVARKPFAEIVSWNGWPQDA